MQGECRHTLREVYRLQGRVVRGVAECMKPGAEGHWRLWSVCDTYFSIDTSLSFYPRVVLRAFAERCILVIK